MALCQWIQNNYRMDCHLCRPSVSLCRLNGWLHATVSSLKFGQRILPNPCGVGRRYTEASQEMSLVLSRLFFVVTLEILQICFFALAGASVLTLKCHDGWNLLVAVGLVLSTKETMAYWFLCSLALTSATWSFFFGGTATSAWKDGKINIHWELNDSLKSQELKFSFFEWRQEGWMALTALHKKMGPPSPWFCCKDEHYVGKWETSI